MTGELDSGAPTLSSAEIAGFRRDGFLVVDRPLAPPAEVEVVRGLLEALFRRFDELPSEWAYDLGDVKLHVGRQQIPEINSPTKFEPKLFDTLTFERCRDIARQLLGPTAHCAYDHTIYKPPHNGAATEWHQDLVTAPTLAGQTSAHIWIPLHDVTISSGCMHFIPRGNATALLPHRRRTETGHPLIAEGVDASRAVACPIRAGMATVHDLTVLHYAGPNATDEPRLAWILHFHP